MTRWPADKQPLAPFFEAVVGQESGGFIPCGVCSIGMTNNTWAVCPRRLLTFDAATPSEQQRPLRDMVLKLAGFKKGDVIRVWSEISLRDRTGFNYRLDYVLRGDRDKPPVIVEIMTASTSGGNKRLQTDMQSAFCNAVLYANGVLPELGKSPGVNARQVWARMASQMIVKSEVANRWGGCTIWVVQDVLMAYIGAQTGLRLEELRSPDWTLGEVNVVSANINNPDDFTLYSGPIHASAPDEACWAQLLSAPSIPDVDALATKLTDNRIISTFTF